MGRFASLVDTPEGKDAFKARFNFNLVNSPDLNKIFQSEIFLHIDGQPCVAHVILRYTLISTCFRSPKNVIKAKNPCLARIDVAVEGFIKRPPPVGTLVVDLTAQQVAQLIQTKEPIPSEEEQEKATKENSVVDLEEDFKVF